MIDRTLKPGDRLTIDELKRHLLIPVNKTEPMPANTLITRVNAMDLGRDGYLFIHFGGATGPMYKDRGNNEFSADCVVNAIFKPR